jgi:hypothetical protein
MTPEELLHTAAAKFANNRMDAYIDGVQHGDCKKKTKQELNWIWAAHYEGYREGYWVATGNSEFSTDPVKLKEK